MGGEPRIVFSSATIFECEFWCRDEYVGQGLDYGEGWLSLRGLHYSCRVVLCWGAEQPTSLGTTGLCSQPLGTTKKGVILGNCRRYEPQWEIWMACSVFWSLQGPFWALTSLTKWRVLLPLPTSPAQWLTCANKEFPYHPLQGHVILFFFYGEQQQKYCRSLLIQNQRLPWESQSVQSISPFRKTGPQRWRVTCPGWWGKSVLALGIWESWAPGCFFSTPDSAIHQQGPTCRTRVIIT